MLRMPQSQLTELYKTQSGRLLAVLTRLFGPHNLQLAEDVLQYAFAQALTRWQSGTVPDNPQGWLMQTAKNKALDLIRSDQKHLLFASDLQAQLSSEWTVEYTLEQAFQASEIKDDQLRMIFFCCHDSVSVENRLPFILKTLCGLSLHAISRALLLPEATVKKRLQRTRQKLKSLPFALPQGPVLFQALETVNTTLYLLFNEGFYCTDGKQAIRLEFCQDAIGLTTLLCESSSLANRETLALLALMHFHIARVDTRVDEQGQVILIDRQNRERWNQAYINMGRHLLTLSLDSEQSSDSDQGSVGRFFLEAKIAEQHCVAGVFEQTNWEKIAWLYAQWSDFAPSLLVTLNRSIAMSYNQELQGAIHNVESLIEGERADQPFVVLSTLAFLYARSGVREEALKHQQWAAKNGGTESENQMLALQIQRLFDAGD